MIQEKDLLMYTPDNFTDVVDFAQNAYTIKRLLHATAVAMQVLPWPRTGELQFAMVPSSE